MTIEQTQKFLTHIENYVSAHFPITAEITVKEIKPIHVLHSDDFYLQVEVYICSLIANFNNDTNTVNFYYNYVTDEFIPDETELFKILKQHAQYKSKNLNETYKIYVDIYQSTSDTNPRTYDITEEMKTLNTSHDPSKNFVNTFFEKYFEDTDSDMAFAELRTSTDNPNYDFIHIEYHKNGLWSYV